MQKKGKAGRKEINIERKKEIMKEGKKERKK